MRGQAPERDPGRTGPYRRGLWAQQQDPGESRPRGPRGLSERRPLGWDGPARLRAVGGAAPPLASCLNPQGPGLRKHLECAAARSGCCEAGGGLAVLAVAGRPGPAKVLVVAFALPPL